MGRLSVASKLNLHTLILALPSEHTVSRHLPRICAANWVIALVVRLIIVVPAFGSLYQTPPAEMERLAWNLAQHGVPIAASGRAASLLCARAHRRFRT